MINLRLLWTPGSPWTTPSGPVTLRPVPLHHLVRLAMSLVVKLEDDLGERSEWVMLHGVVPATSHADFLLLSGIDPFGKTVFNHLQMETFLREWDRAKDLVRDDSQLEAWEKVKTMAETCRQDRDLYL